jgi:hypothetical protein
MENAMLSLRNTTVIALLLTFALSGCSKTQHGVCEPPREDMEWFWQHQDGPPWIGSQDRCVVCDGSVDDGEVAAWVSEHAGDAYLSGPTSESGLTPCLYVYPEGGADFADPMECAKASCAPDPNVNDPVFTSHGMWKVIDPLLLETLEGYENGGEVWQLDAPEDWSTAASEEPRTGLP